jgi:hypothetical protein
MAVASTKFRGAPLFTITELYPVILLLMNIESCIFVLFSLFAVHGECILSAIRTCYHIVLTRYASKEVFQG